MIFGFDRWLRLSVDCRSARNTAGGLSLSAAERPMAQSDNAIKKFGTNLDRLTSVLTFLFDYIFDIHNEFRIRPIHHQGLQIIPELIRNLYRDRL